MKKGIISAAVALATFTGAASANVEGTELRPYIGGGVSFNAADTRSRLSDDGYGFHAGYGVPLHRYFAVEGNTTIQEFERGDPPEDNRWKEYGAEANGLLTYPLGGGWIPYLSAGMGVVKNHLVGGGTGVDLAYQAGSGVFYLFDVASHTWGFRLDAKYRLIETNDSFGDGEINGFDSDFGDVVVKLGAVLLLGQKTVVAAAAPPPTPPPAGPKDSDGDGVPDSKDQCPDTPQGVQVDETGCPLAASVGGDDGIIQRLETVYFDFDRSDVKPSEKPKLDRAIVALKKQKDAKVSIKADGHTDDRGTAGYNDALSERRARAVKAYLVGKGVAADRVVLASFGESKPAATNQTDAGRDLNRRVEVNLIRQ